MKIVVSGKFLFIFFLIFVLKTTSLFACNPDPFKSDSCINPAPTFVIKNNSPGYISQFMSTKLDNVKIEDLEYLLKSSIKTHDVLLSTDNDQVLQKLLKAYSKSEEARLINILNNPESHELGILPFGDLLPHSNQTSPIFSKVSKATETFKKHIHSSMRNDTIGVFVLTINTATDCFTWIHAQNHTVSEQTAEIILNFIVAATFGMNKDLWPAMTKPMHRKILSFLQMWATPKTPVGKFSLQELTSHYFANLAMSVGMQTLRLSIISIDLLSQSFLSPHFWCTSIGLSAIMTFSSFAWSEQLASIDQWEHPVAKNFLRRFTEMRSLLLGHFSPNSQLLQPDVYGYSPWVLMVIHGGLGLTALTHSQRWIDWVESRHWIQFHYEYAEKFSNLLRRDVFSFFTPADMICSKLFLHSF